MRPGYIALHQVVLVEEGVDVVKEGDGSRAVHDPVHLSAQQRQLAGRQTTIWRAQVPLHDQQLGEDGGGNAAALVPHPLEQRPPM